MGFFSWKTADTDEQIINLFAGECKEVFMLSPDGTVFPEPKYEGYGIFGGKDAYVHLAEINGFKLNESPDFFQEDDLREIGIDIELGEICFDLKTGNAFRFYTGRAYFDWVEVLKNGTWNTPQPDFNGLSMNQAIAQRRVVKLPIRDFIVRSKKYNPLKFSFDSNASYEKLKASEVDPEQGFFE